MSDVLSFGEVEGQQVELLAARTVLSTLFGAVGNLAGNNSAGGNSTSSGHTTADGSAYSSPLNRAWEGKGVGGLLNVGSTAACNEFADHDNQDQLLRAPCVS